MNIINDTGFQFDIIWDDINNGGSNITQYELNLIGSSMMYSKKFDSNSIEFKQRKINVNNLFPNSQYNISLGYKYYWVFILACKNI